MNRAFNRKKDKTWMHTPEALSKHYIPYNAKFLGSTEVEQPKGTEVVRDAVRKLKFARHIKKSEGQKIPKVELQISIYGVKILEPKTKEVQHNCQLHRISFCADDKTDKRIFTFICKDSESNKHLCYVFDSEKCAEEITLTIGQAFDLAYRKFLESGGKDVETRKQIAGLQKRNLVFSCDFASLPDASHGDQSSRSSRCWVSGFPCRSDSFVIKLHPFSTLQNIIGKFHCLVVILQDYGYRLHSATRKHKDDTLGT
ncbi:GULP, engulfment adaptor PTB domain containing 1, transcript variant X10 [Ictidomys tridecemlineatus]|nr:GULP, engulfment adaptor PTB domain containing 1, transcript variant X10 [Ictidomys tridecemlineatus]